MNNEKKLNLNPNTVVVAIVLSFTTLISVCIFSLAVIRGKEFESKKDYEMKSQSDHKFNRCLAIAMSESRQSGKPITIQEAQQICTHLETK